MPVPQSGCCCLGNVCNCLVVVLCLQKFYAFAGCRTAPVSSSRAIVAFFCSRAPAPSAVCSSRAPAPPLLSFVLAHPPPLPSVHLAHPRSHCRLLFSRTRLLCRLFFSRTRAPSAVFCSSRPLFAARRSPFAVRRSLFVVCRLAPPVCRVFRRFASPVCRSPFAVRFRRWLCYSPLGAATLPVFRRWRCYAAINKIKNALRASARASA